MNNENKIQVITNDSLSLITKAEIDVQISTAKAFPRSIKQSIDNALTIATISQEVAESCTYALPRGGKAIEGPSVRLAEIVVSAFGNIRSGARIVANDGKTITAQGICHDLETNNCVTVEVKRKITNRKGETFSEDMQVVTGNAACAIVFRNAVFKVIPAALVDSIYQKVKDVSKGTQATLESRRNSAVIWFHNKGIEKDMICRHFEIKAIEDLDIEKLARLTGYKSAIVNDGADITEIFKETGEAVDAETFGQIKEGIEKGTTTLNDVAQYYDISDEQREELEKIKVKSK